MDLPTASEAPKTSRGLALAEQKEDPGGPNQAAFLVSSTWEEFLGLSLLRSTTSSKGAKAEDETEKPSAKKVARVAFRIRSADTANMMGKTELVFVDRTFGDCGDYYTGASDFFYRALFGVGQEWELKAKATVEVEVYVETTEALAELARLYEKRGTMGGNVPPSAIDSETLELIDRVSHSGSSEKETYMDAYVRATKGALAGGVLAARFRIAFKGRVPFPATSAVRVEFHEIRLLGGANSCLVPGPGASASSQACTGRGARRLLFTFLVQIHRVLSLQLLAFAKHRLALAEGLQQNFGSGAVEQENVLHKSTDSCVIGSGARGHDANAEQYSVASWPRPQHTGSVVVGSEKITGAGQGCAAKTGDVGSTTSSGLEQQDIDNKVAPRKRATPGGFSPTHNMDAFVAQTYVSDDEQRRKCGDSSASLQRRSASACGQSATLAYATRKKMHWATQSRPVVNWAPSGGMQTAPGTPWVAGDTGGSSDRGSSWGIETAPRGDMCAPGWNSNLHSSSRKNIATPASPHTGSPRIGPPRSSRMSMIPGLSSLMCCMSRSQSETGPLPIAMLRV
ncbi:unnamed protein product [Amoebophrya sp. A25]|nr:unnamed protein product [Amoebophrya sp. A25]|eukprot:GSA25T00025150001.1